MKIAYYCDGLCNCSDGVGCFRRMQSGIDHCRHTFNPEHAVFGKCDDPDNHPERFHEIDLSDKETCYWEGEVFSSADLAFLNAFTNERELVRGE